MAITFLVDDIRLSVEEYSDLLRRIAPRVAPIAEFARDALGRTCNITARDNGRLVGCARVLTDGYFFSFITDLLVAPDDRDRGLLRNLLRLATDASRTIQAVFVQKVPAEILLDLGWQPGAQCYFKRKPLLSHAWNVGAETQHLNMACRTSASRATIAFRVNDADLHMEEYLVLLYRHHVRDRFLPHDYYPRGDVNGDAVREALERSLNVTARDEGKLIGCARVLSDGYVAGAISALFADPTHDDSLRVVSKLFEVVTEVSPTRILLVADKVYMDMKFLGALGWQRGPLVAVKRGTPSAHRVREEG